MDYWFGLCEAKFSRVDQVKYVEHSLWSGNGPVKQSLSLQILLKTVSLYLFGLFLNTLTQIFSM